MTQKMRSMERSVRALKREKEALKALGMDTKEITAKISRKTREYNEFCGMCGINPKPNRLRYESGTADLKKTKAWKAHESAITPQRNIANRIVYAKKISDFKQEAIEINEELNSVCVKRSKWSGKIIVQKGLKGSGQKEWNCDISLEPTAKYADELHELIHARSISYYDEPTYKRFYNMEEGSVELLTEEICKRKKIDYIETYKKQVNSLRRINRRAKLYVEDYDFAKDLINVELPDRIEWLIKKINVNYTQGIILDKDLGGIWDSFKVLVEEYKE